MFQEQKVSGALTTPGKKQDSEKICLTNAAIVKGASWFRGNVRERRPGSPGSNPIYSSIFSTRKIDSTHKKYVGKIENRRSVVEK